LKWRYFLAEVLISIPFTGNMIVGVEIFSGHCLDSCVSQLDALNDKPFDIISTIFGEFKDDSEPIYVTMLNVTVDVAMNFHMGNLLHLLQLVVILFL